MAQRFRHQVTARGAPVPQGAVGSKWQFVNSLRYYSAIGLFACIGLALALWVGGLFDHTRALFVAFWVFAVSYPVLGIVLRRLSSEAAVEGGGVAQPHGHRGRERDEWLQSQGRANADFAVMTGVGLMLSGVPFGPLAMMLLIPLGFLAVIAGAIMHRRVRALAT